MVPSAADQPGPAVAARQELPIEGKTVRALTLLSVKRTLDLFAGNHGQKVPLDDDGSAPPSLLAGICSSDCNEGHFYMWCIACVLISLCFWT